jgi:hypothetical protein
MNKAIYVQWIDSAGTDRWFPADQADGKVSLIESIGWLVTDGPLTLEMTHSWSSAGNIMGVLAIPKCSILKRHYLKGIKRNDHL